MPKINEWTLRCVGWMGRGLALSFVMLALLALGRPTRANDIDGIKVSAESEAWVGLKYTGPNDEDLVINAHPGQIGSVVLKLEGPVDPADVSWSVAHGVAANLSAERGSATIYIVPFEPNGNEIDCFLSNVHRLTVKINVNPNRQWRSAPAIQDVVMNPANGVTVRPGVDQVLSVTPSKDEDEYSEDGGQTWHRNAADNGQGTTYLWSCEQPEYGDFVPETNPSPLRRKWRANPTTEIRYVTILCTIDDDRTPAVQPPETGTRDDDPPLVKRFYLTVKPAVNAVASFTGKTRICAGGFIGDAIQETILTLRFRDAITTAAVENEPVTIVLAENSGAAAGQGADGEGARQAKIITPGFSGNADDLPTRWPTQTGAGGVLQVRILSSQVIGSADLFALSGSNQQEAIEFRPLNATSGPQAISLRFDPAQGRRGHGIVFFDQGAASDTGFEFRPVTNTTLGVISPEKAIGAAVFQRSGEVIEVRYYLRFYERPANVQAPANTDRYFQRAASPGHPAGPVASVDEDGNRVITPLEISHHTVRPTLGDEAFWKPVLGHRIRFSIRALLNEANAGVPIDPRHIFYCDAQGRPVDEKGVPVAGQQTTLPPYREVRTDRSGVATFYICAGLGFADFHTVRIRALEFEQRHP